MTKEDFIQIKQEEESTDAMVQTQKKNFKVGVVKEESSSRASTATRAASKVKKEFLEDDVNIPRGRRVSGQNKPTKMESSEDSDDDSKPISAKLSSASSKADKKEPVNKKSAVAQKVTKKVKKEEIKTLPTGKKERKVYELPGQKRDPPEERDPLRIFYESLYKQLPKSEMAQIWMMESGLLAKDIAQKVFENKQKKLKLKNPWLGSPVKAVSVAKKSQSSGTKKTMGSAPRATKTSESKAVPKQAKKRKVSDESDDDSDEEFLANRSVKKQRAS